MPNGGGIRIGTTNVITASNNTLGLAGQPASGNLISGNSGIGILVNDGINNQSHYSWVGLQKDGVANLKNVNGGVRISKGSQLNFRVGNRVRG